MTRFLPKLEILPDAQRELWPMLSGISDLGFVLYGGTAVALRLGHRTSVDFDFFTEKELDREILFERFSFLAGAEITQDSANSLSVMVPMGMCYVKISFFGRIRFGRVGTPDYTNDGIMLVAALQDLLATKCKVIIQRAEKKDYIDIIAMIQDGERLAEALGAARALYGNSFQPQECMRAMTYFRDGDLPDLSLKHRQFLLDIVAEVGEIPTMDRVSDRLGVST